MSVHSTNQGSENAIAIAARSFDALEDVEVVSKRQACVKHFALGNGRCQAVTFERPVHFRAGGAWKDIDDTLVEEKETFVTRAGDVKMAFAQKGAREPLAGISYL